MNFEEAKKTIPSNVLEYASLTGFNKISDKIVYEGCSYYPVADCYNGIPLPTGLPTYIKVDKGELSIYSGFLPI